MLYHTSFPLAREAFLYLSIERGISYNAIGHSLMGTEMNELHNESKRMNLALEIAVGFFILKRSVDQR